MEKQQMEAAFRVSHLIFQHLSGKISPVEQSELNAWIEESENNKLLIHLLQDAAQFNRLLNEFYKIDSRKKSTHKKLTRRLFTYKTKIIQFTVSVWKYVA